VLDVEAPAALSPHSCVFTFQRLQFASWIWVMSRPRGQLRAEDLWSVSGITHASHLRYVTTSQVNWDSLAVDVGNADAVMLTALRSG